MTNPLKTHILLRALAALSLSGILLMAFGLESLGKQQTQKDLNRKRSTVQNEIKQAKQQIKLNDREMAGTLQRIQSLDVDIATTQSSLDSLSRITTELNTRSQALKSQIADRQENVDRMRAAYLQQIKQMRLHRGETSSMAYLFSAEDFNQGLQRWRYMRKLSKWRSQQTADIQQQLSLLGEQQQHLDATLAQQTAALHQTRLRRTELQTGQQKQKKLVAQLQADNQGLQQLISRKNNELAQLDRQTAALIEAARRQEEAQRRQQEEARRQETARKQQEEQRRREEARKARQNAVVAEAAPPSTPNPTPTDTKSKNTKAKNPKPGNTASKPQQTPQTNNSTGNGSTSFAEARGRRPRSQQSSGQPQQSSPRTEPQQTANAAGFAAQRGKLPRPVAGSYKIVIPYGHHSRPDMPKVTLDNTGIDIEVSPGATVKAVYDGKVAAIYKAPGFGTVVLLSHGDYYTVYANLTSTSVSNGQHLRQGQAVGSVASSEAPTLHFEIWKQRTRLNPQEWIR